MLANGKLYFFNPPYPSWERSETVFEYDAAQEKMSDLGSFSHGCSDWVLMTPYTVKYYQKVLN